jgi:hypothetical protein
MKWYDMDPNKDLRLAVNQALDIVNPVVSRHHPGYAARIEFVRLK